MRLIPSIFVLIGSRESIERAFSAAGWHGDERHDAMALYHMYRGMVERVGYSRAAMTNLTFNGKPPDIAFQKSLNTLAKRHHIRLWRSAEPDVWLGAATEDVKYKVRGLHITHDIDRDIDNERAKVVNDLVFSGCVYRVGLIPRASFGPIQEDARPIFTDGEVAVVQLNGCEDPQVTPRDPKPSRSVRGVRIARAVVEDIGRSNPVSVGYAMTASMFARSNTRASDRVQAIVHYTRPIAIANLGDPPTPESRPVISTTRMAANEGHRSPTRAFRVVSRAQDQYSLGTTPVISNS
jgi:LssY C-terminus